MADIAFLLLIFFLVTTTMDTEVGLSRLLSPMAQEPPAPVAKENILLVQLNDAGELLVGDDPVTREDLAARVIAFLTNPDDRDDLPHMIPVSEATCLARIATLGDGPERTVWQQRLDAVRLIGPYREAPVQTQILLRTGPGVTYAQYIAVQDVLDGVVSNLRDELAKRTLGVSFDTLDEMNANDRKYIRSIKRAIPKRLGDAELVVR